MKKLLILENGDVFEGKAFGSIHDTIGELVFTTGMTGYQESITDQSYSGQILTFTYPLIGNYGINRGDYESINPTIKGIVVKQVARKPGSWRAQMTLDEFLRQKDIPGISGVDTRALAKIIRKFGTMKASLISKNPAPSAPSLSLSAPAPSAPSLSLSAPAPSAPSLSLSAPAPSAPSPSPSAPSPSAPSPSLSAPASSTTLTAPSPSIILSAFTTLKQTHLPTDQVKQVSTDMPYPCPRIGYNVAVIDFGLKHSILQELSKRGCNLTVFPHNISAKTILDFCPDAVMLTNGPGDPKDVPEAIETIKGILGKLPIFGICLGHQLLALANGADTYKMKFGHRGFNHAVKDFATGRIDFTSQNHGYAIDKKSIDPKKLIVTHVDINDGTIEGIHHRYHPAFSVQYHPDVTPGPNDAKHLFDEFMEMIDSFKQRKKEGK